jgi:predicted glycosyltransferase
VVFYDTENATSTNRWVYPLAAAVCTPDCYSAPVRGNHITYPGYHELAYLHPDRFIPDPAVPAAAGLRPGEWFALLRFVGWQASHDLRDSGLTAAGKRAVTEQLAQSGRVFVSSEGPLPEDLPAEPIPVPAAQVHHLMAAAAIMVGESATMASEAAVLGVPAVLISDTGRGYTDDQERRYGLVRRVSPGDPEDITTAVAEMGKERSRHLESRRTLLGDKIDTTDWMVHFITERRWER